MCEPALDNFPSRFSVDNGMSCPGIVHNKCWDHQVMVAHLKNQCNSNKVIPARSKMTLLHKLTGLITSIPYISQSNYENMCGEHGRLAS